MKIRQALLFALLAMAVPAKADVQAAYSDGTMVEINDDGTIRANVASESSWALHTGGRDYLIVNDGGVEVALDARIVAQVAHDAIPPMLAQMMSSVDPMVLSPAGTHEVNGRKGTGYRVDNEREIAFVISRDPKISDVGAALARHYRAVTEMSGPMAPLMRPVSDLLAKGAAIRIGNVELLWVADGELDDERFALPSPPLDRNQTEAVMRRNGLLKTG